MNKRICILTDTHCGCRLNSEAFLNNQKEFYEKVFFPSLDKSGIDQILHLGDYFDSPTSLNIRTLKLHREMFLDECKDKDIHLTILAGNHDSYYKDSLDTTSILEFFSSYENVDVVDNPVSLSYSQLPIVAIPWINAENEKSCLSLLKSTEAKICVGHFEMKGFERYKGVMLEEGLDPKIFKKFKTVLSGHYHHKSSKGNIHYLGSPFEITWNDCGEERGFHILDISTGELEFVENPHSMFRKVSYDDEGKTTDQMLAEVSKLKLAGKVVKLIVYNKTNEWLYGQYIKELEAAGPEKLEIVPLSAQGNSSDAEVSADKDTLEMILEAAKEIPTDSDKKEVIKLLRELYLESTEGIA